MVTGGSKQVLTAWLLHPPAATHTTSYGGRTRFPALAPSPSATEHRWHPSGCASQLGRFRYCCANEMLAKQFNKLALGVPNSIAGGTCNSLCLVIRLKLPRARLIEILHI